MDDIKRLIAKVNAGEPGAQDALFSAAYAELRKLARARLHDGGRNTCLDTRGNGLHGDTGGIDVLVALYLALDPGGAVRRERDGSQLDLLAVREHAGLEIDVNPVHGVGHLDKPEEL